MAALELIIENYFWNRMNSYVEVFEVNYSGRDCFYFSTNECNTWCQSWKKSSFRSLFSSNCHLNEQKITELWLVQW